MLAEIGITRKSVLKYALLPGILPRVSALAGSGFYNLALLVATVFNAVRILPDNHPYLRADSLGTYGLRHVIAEAANHIVPCRKNIDQIVVFFSILAAIVILVLQFILILIAVFISPARAATMPTTYSEFFVTRAPETDLAFRALDMVFGVPDLFNSKESVGTPLQLALQSLFEFYSYGLLLVGFFIILYFVVTIVAETAQTGTPFGKRFNHAWTPIRLSVFFALLLPVTSGLNGGQMISLYAAKYGSGLATNGWLKFNEVLNSSEYLGKMETLYAKPNTPEMAYLYGYILLARTCLYAEGRAARRNIEAFVIYGPGPEDAKKLSETTASNVSEETEGGDIHIRFGEQDPILYKNRSGSVYPYCGEVVLKTSDMAEPGATKIQEGYYDLVKELWEGAFDIDKHAKNFSLKYSSVEPRIPETPIPDAKWKAETSKGIQEKAEKIIEDGLQAQRAGGNVDPDADMEILGWAGAGIWYNKIAQKNGALTTAAMNTPEPILMPSVMEWIKSEKVKQDKNVSASDTYSPSVSDNQLVEFEYPEDHDKARVLHQVSDFVMSEGIRQDDMASQTKLTGNIVIDAINLLFGTRGLFEMCENTDIHPLAQLASLGKTMVNNAIGMFGGSIFAGAAGGLAKLSEAYGAAGDTLFALASFFTAVASIGLLVGFLLFYVIPFLPFIYFFFAVSGWVKGLFEAMVGVPLWALAHLRIGGDGLPGEAAMSGYFLIFEIFIRPILIVFGLLASIAIFAAMVRVLNDIFYLVITNLSGQDPLSTTSCFSAPDGSGGIDPKTMFRGPLDEFFFTVIYAIIVYMIGMSCFKLIDNVPNHILRWMNAGVPAFNDKSSDPAEGLVKYMAVGGGRIGQQLQGGMKDMAGNLSGMFKKGEDG